MTEETTQALTAINAVNRALIAEVSAQGTKLDQLIELLTTISNQLKALQVSAGDTSSKHDILQEDVRSLSASCAEQFSSLRKTTEHILANGCNRKSDPPDDTCMREEKTNPNNLALVK